jgi:ketol-acid reductoisomerase
MDNMNNTEIVDVIAKLGITGTWLRDDEWWSYTQMKQVAEEHAKEAQREIVKWIEDGNWMGAYAISVMKNELQL